MGVTAADNCGYGNGELVANIKNQKLETVRAYDTKSLKIKLLNYIIV